MLGNADTSMGGKMGQGSLQANGELMAEPLMHVDNVGDAVVYVAGMPKGVNVLVRLSLLKAELSVS